VWPLSEGLNWRLLHKDERRKRVDLAKHALIVMVSAPANQQEAACLEAFKIKMDSKLKPTSLESEYFGNFAGTDLVDGECRIFFTCPDADHSLEFIKLDLLDLSWSRWLWVVRRYGDLWDSDAEEKITKFRELNPKTN
jgi:hypothetical protein